MYVWFTQRLSIYEKVEMRDFTKEITEKIFVKKEREQSEENKVKTALTPRLLAHAMRVPLQVME